MSGCDMRRWIAGLCVLANGLLLGCAAGGGGAALCPQGHELHPAADELRGWAPQLAPLPRELQKVAIQPYIIQPGDVLLIEPVSFDSPVRLAADQTVLVDGTIDLGKYGRPIVVGKTVEEIESLVQGMISSVEREDADINVRLINPQAAMFYVLGEVNAPGSYPLIGRETVLDAIMAAGGLTDRASHCEIILSRPSPPDGCRIVLPICYDLIVQTGDTSTNFQIMPGDRIFVATRSCLDGIKPDFMKKPCPYCCTPQCPCGAAIPPVPPPVTFVPYGPMVVEPPISTPVPPAPQVEATWRPTGTARAY